MDLKHLTPELSQIFTKSLSGLTVLLSIANIGQLISPWLPWYGNFYGDWIGWDHLAEAKIVGGVAGLTIVISLTYSLLQAHGNSRFKMYVILLPLGVVSLVASVESLTRVSSPKVGMFIAIGSSIAFLSVLLNFISRYRSVGLHQSAPQTVVVQAPSAPVKTAAPSISDELKKFHELFQGGAISEAEYETQKKRLLG
jgi:Short C-terminal domain